MALLLLSTSCAVQIKDYTYCAEVPGNFGAVCDNFLTANQQILTQPEWEAMKAAWNEQGQAVECTTSGAVGDLKAELEKLCSKVACNYVTAEELTTMSVGNRQAKDALRKTIAALNKMQQTAQRSVNSSLPSTSTNVAE